MRNNFLLNDCIEGERRRDGEWEHFVPLCARKSASLIILLSWFLFGSFVSDVVHIYYTRDEAVQGDREIQAFVNEVCTIGMHDSEHCSGFTSKTSSLFH